MIPDRNGKHLVNQWLQGILLTMRLRLLTPTGLFDLPSQLLNCHLYFRAMHLLFHDGQWLLKWISISPLHCLMKVLAILPSQPFPLQI